MMSEIESPRAIAVVGVDFECIDVEIGGVGGGDNEELPIFDRMLCVDADDFGEIWR